jgi:predicted NodU family carbamoyl transferase
MYLKQHRRIRHIIFGTAAKSLLGVQMEMTDQEYQDVHKRCGRALQVYIREANRTCELLGRADYGPSGLSARAVIAFQRHRENEAHAQFCELRNGLMDLVRLGYRDCNWPPND